MFFQIISPWDPSICKRGGRVILIRAEERGPEASSDPSRVLLPSPLSAPILCPRGRVTCPVPSSPASPESCSPFQDMFAAAVSLVTGKILYISDQVVSIFHCKRGTFHDTKFVEFLAPHDVGVFHSRTTPCKLPPWSVRHRAGEGPAAGLPSPSPQAAWGGAGRGRPPRGAAAHLPSAGGLL